MSLFLQRKEASYSYHVELLGKEGKRLDGNWKEIGLIKVLPTLGGGAERITGTLWKASLPWKHWKGS